MGRKQVIILEQLQGVMKMRDLVLDCALQEILTNGKSESDAYDYMHGFSTWFYTDTFVRLQHLIRLGYVYKPRHGRYALTITGILKLKEFK